MPFAAVMGDANRSRGPECASFPPKWPYLADVDAAVSGLLPSRRPCEAWRHTHDHREHHGSQHVPNG